MIDDVVQSLLVLQKAETLIGRMWLNVLARRLGFLEARGLRLVGLQNDDVTVAGAEMEFLRGALGVLFNAVA